MKKWFFKSIKNGSHCVASVMRMVSYNLIVASTSQYFNEVGNCTDAF